MKFRVGDLVRHRTEDEQWVWRVTAIDGNYFDSVLDIGDKTIIGFRNYSSGYRSRGLQSVYNLIKRQGINHLPEWL